MPYAVKLTHASAAYVCYKLLDSHLQSTGPTGEMFSKGKMLYLVSDLFRALMEGAPADL
jgi:hypothetical protein